MRKFAEDLGAKLCSFSTINQLENRAQPKISNHNQAGGTSGLIILGASLSRLR
jgi:hypothetical protein